MNSTQRMTWPVLLGAALLAGAGCEAYVNTDAPPPARVGVEGPAVDVEVNRKPGGIDVDVDRKPGGVDVDVDVNKSSP